MAVGAPGHPQLPPATPRNHPPFIASLLLFSFHGDGSNQYSIHRQTFAGNMDINIARNQGKVRLHHYILLVIS